MLPSLIARWWAGVRHFDGTDLKLFLSVAWSTEVQLLFSFAPESVGYSALRDLHRRAANSVYESWFLIHQDINHYLFFVLYNSLTS